MKLTNQQRREAMSALGRLVEKIEAGELTAPAWYVERLRGVIAGLSAQLRR